jgi:hypothetical protein
MNRYRHTTIAACLLALVLAAGATQASASSNVTVDMQGGGSGRVAGPEGLNCPGVCLVDMETWYDTIYQPAVLTAFADPGSIFAGWGGACLFSRLSSTCEIPSFYDGTRTAIARFERLSILRPSTLTVSVAGTGTGNVTGPGIACPGDCAQGYMNDATVTLTATSVPGSSFTGWSGACSGSAPACTLTMGGAKSVTAAFTADAPAAGGEPGPISGPSSDCTIRGTRGNDILAGTRGRDVICGLAGRDTLVGRGGNDVLRGGAGRDLLRGGRGRDVLNGGSGVDRARVQLHRDITRSIELVL